MKHRPAGSKEFFWNTYATQIKNSWKVVASQLYRAYSQKHSDQKYYLVILGEFFRQADKIYFLDNMSQLLIHLPPEAKTWHKA